jgi:hypothetical protein
MEIAIDTMKAACSEDVRHTFKKLKLERTLNNFAGRTFLPIGPIARRVFADARDKAKYNTIVYDDGAWRESALPYHV